MGKVLLYIHCTNVTILILQFQVTSFNCWICTLNVNIMLDDNPDELKWVKYQYFKPVKVPIFPNITLESILDFFRANR